MTIKTISLEEAAKILHAHKETVRLKAKRGEIPGQKVGKNWIFSQLAIERYLAGEWVPRVVEGKKEIHQCHSTNEVTAHIGITRYTRLEAEKSYEEALAPKTKGKPRNSMIA
ncbi:MAG: helix-turn-helix domain-containing protein [Oxalobacter formigenes]|nr:helix-turn-helix domain-containing protein [Oxalobacter formigenes]